MKPIYNKKRARILLVDPRRPSAEITWIVRRGEQVCFDEFPEGLFFLVGVGKGFVVVEFQTGCRVADKKKTRALAISTAREELIMHGHYNIMVAIETEIHHNYSMEKCQRFKLNSIVRRK